MRAPWRPLVLALLLPGAAPALAFAPCPDAPPLLADGQITFEPDSDDVGPAGREAIRQLAERAITRRVRQICLYGSASRREADPGGHLALDRAEAVALELRMAGVPGHAIEIVPAAETDALLGLAGNERRVDILLEP